MGNKKSVPSDTSAEFIIENYEFYKKCLDARFGEVKWLKNSKDGTVVLQKDSILNSQKEYENHINQIKKRSSIYHPNIIRVLAFNTKHEEVFCANYHKISTFFEAFEIDLEEIVEAKISKSTRLPETELWYILDSIVAACAYLQDNNEFHGDIRPFSILMTATKEYKILDKNTFSREVFYKYFALLTDFEDRARFYSPRLFAALGKGKQLDSVVERNIFKSDVYCLGLTLLECASLQKSERFFDWKTYTVDQEQIMKSLGELRQFYTSTFLETLSFMLTFDDDERPDFLALDSELAPFRADIRSRVLKSDIPEINLNAEQQLFVPTVKEQQVVEDDDDLDKRVREAIEKSESTILRSSAKPTFVANQDRDAYYDEIIKNYNAKYGFSDPMQLETKQQQQHAQHAQQQQATQNLAQPVDKKPLQQPVYQSESPSQKFSQQPVYQIYQPQERIVYEQQPARNEEVITKPIENKPVYVSGTYNTGNYANSYSYSNPYAGPSGESTTNTNMQAPGNYSADNSTRYQSYHNPYSSPFEDATYSSSYKPRADQSNTYINPINGENKPEGYTKYVSSYKPRHREDNEPEYYSPF